jgi:hypothetical protein
VNSPRFQIIFPFLTFFALYENNFALQRIKLISRMKNLVVKISFWIIMFDLSELKLMFLDPTDLIINNINKFLYSNKTIKFIFS